MSNSTSINYHKEYQQVQQALNDSSIVNIVPSIIDVHIAKLGTDTEKTNNTSDEVYLRAIVELFANILEDLTPERQKELDQFLQESGTNQEERIYKMIYTIMSYPTLQGQALKKASTRLYSWLKLNPDSDYSELQSEIYNLGLELTKTQAILNK